MGYVLGIDIGGTFTDCIAIDEDGKAEIGKAFSTPPDFHDGFLESIAAVAERIGIGAGELLSQADGVYHGCTVGTNALVEGRTAKVALLTTRGHRDSIFSMKAGRRLQNQPYEYIAEVAGHRKPDPIVPRALVREIDERVAADGETLVALDEEQVRAVVAELLEEGVGAFAVSLLWSVADDSHEQRIAEIVAEMAPEAFVSVASRVISRTGEYERTVATVVNGLIGPEMSAYLRGLEQRCREAGYAGAVQIMTCSGGLISTEEARVLPVLTIGSGPVAGLIGSRKIADAEHDRGDAAGGGSARSEMNIITGDVGGTTFDVGVVHRGVPLSRRTSWYDQYEYFVPTLDVRSVGAGGGSIIRYDEATGALRVGPRSAGARPGPVCIRRGGTEPTVTDANLIAGVFDPEYFLGGQVELDIEAAVEALARVGEEVGLGPEETAAAALRIADNQMADAIRLASVQRGIDVRDFVLFAYGGGGPVHGAAVAQHVGIGRVVVPFSDLAAGWSAFGIAGAEPLAVEETAERMSDPFSPASVNAAWERLEAEASARMERQGIGRERLAITRHADMRYSLQVNELEVPAPDGEYDEGAIAELVDRFEREYERVYGEGTGYAAAGFTITGLRVRCRAQGRSHGGVGTDQGDGGPAMEPHASRRVNFYSTGLEPEEVPIYRPGVPPPGATLAGPAILELADTTIVVPHGANLAVDPRGSLNISLQGVSADGR